MRANVPVAISASLALLPACMSPQSPLARAQETTQDFNLDRRFGRSDDALEHVANAARDNYSVHHKAWGAGIRIADVEMGGVRIGADKDAEVMVRVSWYRPEQNDLHLTLLRQKWHDQDGWKLVTEERVEGDTGLLGDTVVVESPGCASDADAAPCPRSEAATHPQFPTIRLGAPD
jgi:hypothetical protein